MNNTPSKKVPVFTPRKIIRALAFLCLIFVFCPSFLVSCSGRDVEVDVMTAVQGVTMYGETIVDPHPIMLVCLILPVLIISLTIIKKGPIQKAPIFIFSFSVADLLIWNTFKGTVEKVASDNYCTMEVTGWYVTNFMSLIAIAALSGLIVIKRMGMDANILAALLGFDPTKGLNGLGSTDNQAMFASVLNSNTGAPVETIGFCEKCGNAIEPDCRFCTSCGEPVPEDLILEAMEKCDSAQANACCAHCGATLDSDAVFCTAYGTKVE